MIIGLVGKSGSGKTTVSRYLKTKGYYHLDTDTLTEPTYNLLKKEIVVVTENSVLINNQIDKVKLHLILAKSEILRFKIEKLILPEIRKQVVEILNSHGKIVIDSAILYKLDLANKLDLILYIDTTWYLRLYRLLKRDNYNLIKVLRRLWIQRDININLYDKAKLILNVNKVDTLNQIDKLL